MKETTEKKKPAWTLRRVLALIGIILLLALYASTLVFALMDDPAAKGLLMASIYCTIALPILLYAMILVTRRLRGNSSSGDDSSNEDGK